MRWSGSGCSRFQVSLSFPTLGKPGSTTSRDGRIIKMSQKEAWQELLSSGLRGDIVVLFRKNPGIIDTLEGVARRLGVSMEAIEEDTSQLVKIGFLKMRRFGPHDALLLDEKRDREIQESAKVFLLSKIQGGGSSS